MFKIIILSILGTLAALGLIAWGLNAFVNSLRNDR